MSFTALLPRVTEESYAVSIVAWEAFNPDIPSGTGHAVIVTTDLDYQATNIGATFYLKAKASLKAFLKSPTNPPSNPNNQNWITGHESYQKPLSIVVRLQFEY